MRRLTNPSARWHPRRRAAFFVMSLWLMSMSIFVASPPLPAQSADAGRGDASAVFATDKGAVRCAQLPGHIDCLGIPYAAPPLGALRFRPPVAAAAWSGVRDASRFAPACLQAKTDYVKAQQGAEDCLYLNVYKPATSHAGEALPVMVWMHGGGFMNGSGNAFYGAYLAQTAHAIVVTVNYRLGPFGWLALDSLAAESPLHAAGNYGLLDNIAALRWVRRNIAGFGGDPNRVTTFGQSAGGEMVLALLASPYAQGLFQRAISMSAPASLPMPTLQAAGSARARFLRELGCAEPASELACLRRASAERVLAAAHENWNLVGAGGLQWTPVVDGVVFPEQWLGRFRRGAFNQVPVMFGQMRQEGRLHVAIFENDQNGGVTENEIDGIVKDHARLILNVDPAAYRRAYPAQAFETPGVRLALTVTDGRYVAGEIIDRQALARHVPVYGYQSCDPRAPESHVHARFDPIECGHDSDLAYLFQWDDADARRPELSAEQWQLARIMGRYWGNFAATGDPNGAGLPYWPRQTATAAPMQRLEPASTGGVRPLSDEDYRAEHKFAFWQPYVLGR